MGAFGFVLPDGTTNIPAEVRERLGLAGGSRLEWTVEDGQAIVRPSQEKGRAVELAGILGNPLGRPVSIEEMDQGIADHLGEDDARISREWHEGRR